MNFFKSIANRHLLLALIALGGLNVILCLVIFLREQSNRSLFDKLNGDLVQANMKHERDLKKFAQETNLKNQQVFDELRRTTKKLEVAQTNINNNLESTGTKINNMQKSIEQQVRNHPWLLEPEKSQPLPSLADLSKRLDKFEMDLLSRLDDIAKALRERPERKD